MNNTDAVKNACTWGLIPAVPVPRYYTGQIHAKAQEAYAQYLSEQPIAGAAVWAHTGRGLHLDRHERKQVLEVWKSALGEQKLLIAGVGAIPDNRLLGSMKIRQWERDSLGMAADAIHWGADALLVFPPAIFKGLPPGERDEAIVSYHCKLSRFGCPLVLFYLYDEAGGVSYSAEVLRELLALPRTLGIKVATLDSVMTLQDVSTLISSEFPEKLLITGEDRMFGYSLMRGARSALVGLGAAFPGIQRDLMRAFAEGNFETFLALSSRVDAYAERTFIRPMDKYILRMLWCLALSGVIPEEAAHDITGYDMTREEIEALRQVIADQALY